MALFCNKCGQKNRKNAKFCNNCGNNFPLSSPSGPLKPGTVLENRYKIIKLIKAGGMGAIYKVTDEKLDRVWALKELLPDYGTPEEQEEARKWFKREAKLLAGLDHANLPTVSDYFIANGRYYLIMTFVEGEDMEGILKKEGNPGLAEEKVVETAKEVLLVLEYLHSRNPPVIYRDIKPANIMIHKDGRAMLIDFGIARAIQKNQSQKTAIGTPGYAPVEQCRGKAEPRSDLYALAATMHHLLTGVEPLPFRFEPVRKLNCTISPELEQFLIKALKDNVEERFSCAGEMLQALSFSKEKNSGTQEKIEKKPDKSNYTGYDWQSEGNALCNSGKYKEALECYDKAAALVPQYGPVWNNKGIALYNLGKYKEAISCYEKALEIDPEYTDALYNRGSALYDIGYYEEALKCYDRVIEIDPEFTRAWNSRGFVLEKQGLYRKAIASYDKAIELEPDYKSSWSNKGYSLHKLGNYEEALRCQNKAIEIDPDFTSAWNNKGFTLSTMENYREAIICYDRAIELDRDYDSAWNNKGYALYNLGNYREALLCYDSALKINPRNGIAWNNKGLTLNSLGEYAKGIVCFDNALDIMPDHAVTWHNKGCSFLSLNSYKEALACFEKAVTFDAALKYSWNNMGDCLYKLGNYEGAIRYYSKAADLDPNFILAKNNRAGTIHQLALEKLKTPGNPYGKPAW